MTDDPEAALLDAVQADPEDTQAREIYADFLEGRGDPRGEYLRLEMQLQTLPARVAALAQRVDPEWIHAIGGRYQIAIVGCGPNKIAAIKAVREVTGVGLREALELVDLAAPERPSPLFEDIERAPARDIIAKLEPLMKLQIQPRLGASPPLPKQPAYRRPYRVLLVGVTAGRRLDTILFLHQHAAKPLVDARAIVDQVEAGTPFELAGPVDATIAADLAAELGGMGSVRIERVSA